MENKDDKIVKGIEKLVQVLPKPAQREFGEQLTHTQIMAWEKVLRDEWGTT